MNGTLSITHLPRGPICSRLRLPNKPLLGVSCPILQAIAESPANAISTMPPDIGMESTCRSSESYHNSAPGNNSPATILLLPLVVSACTKQVTGRPWPTPTGIDLNNDRSISGVACAG